MLSRMNAASLDSCTASTAISQSEGCGLAAGTIVSAEAEGGGEGGREEVSWQLVSELASCLASCELTFTEKSRIGLTAKLSTRNRTAFEILTSKTDHGFTPLF